MLCGRIFQSYHIIPVLLSVEALNFWLGFCHSFQTLDLTFDLHSFETVLRFKCKGVLVCFSATIGFPPRFNLLSLFDGLFGFNHKMASTALQDPNSSNIMVNKFP